VTARPTVPEDLATLTTWASAHGVHLPRVVPPGFIVDDGAYIGLEVVGDRAWLELALACPTVSRSKGYAALAACLHACETWARDNHVRTLFAFTDHPAMGAWITKQGYREQRGFLTAKEM